MKNLQANISEIPTDKLWLRLNFNSLHLSELNSTLLHNDLLQVIKALRIDVNRFIIPHFLIQNTSLDNTPLSQKFKISFQIFKEYAQYTLWEKGNEGKIITVLIYGTLEFEMLREEYFDWWFNAIYKWINFSVSAEFNSLTQTCYTSTYTSVFWCSKTMENFTRCFVSIKCWWTAIPLLFMLPMLSQF